MFVKIQNNDEKRVVQDLRVSRATNFFSKTIFNSSKCITNVYNISFSNSIIKKKNNNIIEAECTISKIKMCKPYTCVHRNNYKFGSLLISVQIFINYTHYCCTNNVLFFVILFVCTIRL